MTLEQAFNSALKKGYVTLRSLATHGITSVEFFKFVGWKGYVAEMGEKTYYKGDNRPIIEIFEKDKRELDIERMQLLPCSIPKYTIVNICRHWKQCHIGERGDCEKSGYSNQVSKM